ncbi:MAG: hypothetical protein O7F72_06915 [Proteobacteria bacterium]|nr:hypothetical protein [Pseudomonadota bacterium]
MKKILIASVLAFSVMLLSACAAALLGGQSSGTYGSTGDGRGTFPRPMNAQATPGTA